MGREDPIEFYNLNLINYLFFLFIKFYLFYWGDI